MKWGAAGLVLVAVGASLPGPQLPEGDRDLARFYAGRGGTLAWSAAGRISPQAAELLGALLRAGEDGLDPDDYQAGAIDSLLRLPATPDRLGRLDTLLTTAFLAMGRDLAQGRVAPGTVDSSWTGSPARLDPAGRLERALAAGAVAESLGSLRPPHPGYAGLRAGLPRYRRVAAEGGWPEVPGGPLLEPGARDPRVGALRRRLTAEGYRTGGGTDLGYDPALASAVRAFQAAHGLAPDGVVGPATLAELDVPVAVRVAQIEANLERWRWLPKTLGDAYLMANSAAQRLELVERGVPVARYRIVAGRPDRPTPIVGSRIGGVVFRPLWRIPHRIAVEEVLPLARRDTTYMTRADIRVFEDSAKGGREIPRDSIRWQTVRPRTFPYRLVQEPGPENPLGGVKLVLATRFAVYLHDTPNRAVFGKEYRLLSHGCIRVEGIERLVARLLPEWGADSIGEAMKTGRDRLVELADPVPVHLVYWTAWGGAAGPVEFRPDAYGWDALLLGAISGRSRVPARTRSSPPGGTPARGAPTHRGR